MAHIHAELMARYAEDAKEHDRPWKLWQRCDGESWVDCTIHPGWFRDSQYRRKPRTIKIGDYEVPEPCRVAPPNGTPYWTFTQYGGQEERRWIGLPEDLEALKNGTIHLDAESADKHWKAVTARMSKLWQELMELSKRQH